uniref:Dynein heavy chain tail domain-containing protein n=1 Tax=Timema tahoe TaxID=61484 RepID=A0A7R9FLR4_9NEOP|nr:unnamed protein product [Timema tahoe]
MTYDANDVDRLSPTRSKPTASQIIWKDFSENLEAAGIKRGTSGSVAKMKWYMDQASIRSWERLSDLCRAFSNQIILQCRQSVDLPFIFKGNSQVGIKILKDCIECCVMYKLLYEKISEAHKENGDKVWVLDEASIFNHVDSFCQRCRDLIEVCDAMIIFGRMDETQNIAMPSFGGTRGEEFEKVCENIEKNFNTYLQAIKDTQDTILDVQVPTWYDDILRFRSHTKELEVVIENLMDSVFEIVQHAEEGLHALQAFYHYSKRSAVRKMFDKKTVYVYKLFEDDLQATKKELVDEKEQYPASLPYYAGRALMARLKKRRLERLMKMLDDAEWLPYCGVGEEVRTQYNKLVKTIDDTVMNIYHKWIDSLDENMAARLNRPLLCRSLVHQGLLESNFDRKLLIVCRESKFWDMMSFDIPNNVQQVYYKWENIKYVYESVLQVVRDYNNIIASLSDEERVLFRELIRGCDKKINPGLHKLQWNTDVSDLYISECCQHTAEEKTPDRDLNPNRPITGVPVQNESDTLYHVTTNLQVFVDDFKNSNLEVVRICEKICDTPLIEIHHGVVYKLKDLDRLMAKHR